MGIDILRDGLLPTKLQGGNLWVPIAIGDEGDRLSLKFRYNKSLIPEIKAFDGARWNPEKKCWTIKNNERNLFQLAYLAGWNPYGHYDRPLVEPQFTRPLREHQVRMLAQAATYHYHILAAEMGTGKTLVAIELMDNSGFPDWWYIAPRSALAAVSLELRKWNAKVRPILYTYDALKKILDQWQPGTKAPRGVIFDESSRIKTPTAQRSLAAYHLARAIREEYGWDGYVIEMSGSPAPKSPADWWWQCEVAMPGFLREGTIDKFKNRLGLIVQKESITGGTYPHLVTWLDDTRKCMKCGKLDTDPIHNPAESVFSSNAGDCHGFVESKNEVAYLYERMKGLVSVFFKKDCFSGDTEVLTINGPMKFRDALGQQKLYVRTDRGFEWLTCEIKSFGLQETYAMYFGDGSECRTTANHRWLTLDRGKIEKRHRRTYELLVGKSQIPLSPIQLPELDVDFWVGMAHGFVFGDGHNYQNNPGDPIQSKVELFGYDRDLKSLLLKYGSLSYHKQKDGSYTDVICNLPGNWKQLPEKPNKSYALGFVLGVQQADGAVDETNVRVGQSNHGDLTSIRELAIYAGLRCQPIRLARHFSPLDGSEKPYWEFSIQSYNLSKDHFLRSDYKEQLSIRGRGSATTVSAINWNAKREEEVFCAVVPHWQNFTLANGVNCMNCLDLPDKQYRIIRLKPNQATLNAARLITKVATTTVQGLTLLRELSDGFQYEETKIGTTTCSNCHGEGVVLRPMPKEDAQDLQERIGAWRKEIAQAVEIPDEYLDDYGEIIPDHVRFSRDFEEKEVSCPTCGGSGEVPRYQRETKMVACPKQDALLEILESHEDDGRLVIYAGFTGSVDRCVQIVEKMKWDWIRVDGRGWSTSLEGLRRAEDMLLAFQDRQTGPDKIAFIGQPSAAGMGLTLTASCEIVFYSNDFNAESRIQAQDRIHRVGMDVNRGATITDLIHLPSDELILNNLTKKIRLQDMTLGQFNQALKDAESHAGVRQL